MAWVPAVRQPATGPTQQQQQALTGGPFQEAHKVLDWLCLHCGTI